MRGNSLQALLYDPIHEAHDWSLIVIHFVFNIIHSTEVNEGVILTVLGSPFANLVFINVSNLSRDKRYESWSLFSSIVGENVTVKTASRRFSNPAIVVCSTSKATYRVKKSLI